MPFCCSAYLCMGAAFFGKKIPGSFLPDEDQGYLFAGLQLPDASSLQRSSDAARQVEEIIKDTPGVQYVSSVMGYSMLSGVNATYSSFFFVSLKPWDERKTPETSYEGIKAHLQRALSQVSSPELLFRFRHPLFRALEHREDPRSFLRTAPGVAPTFSPRTRNCSCRPASGRN